MYSMDTHMPAQSASDAPCTETEKILVAIWSEVLDIQNFGAHNDFLSLGGDSMAAMRCINRVSAVFGVELSVDLFLLDSASVAKVAFEVDKARLSDSNIIRSDGA
jgi:acyl carrier protein